MQRYRPADCKLLAFTFHAYKGYVHKINRNRLCHVKRVRTDGIADPSKPFKSEPVEFRIKPDTGYRTTNNRYIKSNSIYI